MNEYLQTNLAHWEELAARHPDQGYFDVPGFLRGECRLNPLEVEELGDVRGKSLLHLQCHFGLDTLSWARRGARVTGVDFSPEAISQATSLAAQAGLDARFIRSEVTALPDVLEEQFDIVFTSYGALCWLGDLDVWAGVVDRMLRPGGTFYVAEIHPVAMIWDEHDPGLKPHYTYFPAREPLRYETEGSYAGLPSVTNNVTYDWQHSLGEVVTAICRVGLRIEYLHEFPFCCYQALPAMVKGEDGWWRLPGNDTLPFTYSIRATKPA